MPQLSTIGVVYAPLNLGFKIFKFIDQGWTEFFGAQKIFKYFIEISSFFQIIQFNNLKIHITLFCFWLLVLMLFMLMII